MKFVNLKVCDCEKCESDMRLLTCICIVLYWKPFAMERSIHLVFLLSRLLEVFCTLYCLLLSVHTLLFVTSTYLELNSHFDHVFGD